MFGIVTRPAVAEADIEKPVGTECQVAPVVIRVWLHDVAESAWSAPAHVEARRRIRNQRIGKTVPPELWERRAIPPSGRPLGEYLQAVGDGESARTQCTWCGHELGAGRQRWKDRVVVRALPMEAAGRFRDGAEGLVLRQFYCPRCATLLDTEVVLETDPPLYDEVFEWPGTKGG